MKKMAATFGLVAVLLVGLCALFTWTAPDAGLALTLDAAALPFAFIAIGSIVPALPSPTATIRSVLNELKPAHLIVGTIVFIATAWTVSRLLPGAARRVGIAPRPIHAMQNTWPEPFGTKPLLPMRGAASPAASPAASVNALANLSEEDKGRLITSLASGGASDLLAQITGGSGDTANA
jgi:hypothetical protein